MIIGNAYELMLCYIINRTADYVASCAHSDIQDQYVKVLETSTVGTMMYWRLLDCLTA